MVVLFDWLVGALLVAVVFELVVRIEESLRQFDFLLLEVCAEVSEHADASVFAGCAELLFAEGSLYLNNLY